MAPQLSTLAPVKHKRGMLACAWIREERRLRDGEEGCAVKSEETAPFSDFCIILFRAEFFSFFSFFSFFPGLITDSIPAQRKRSVENIKPAAVTGAATRFSLSSWIPAHQKHQPDFQLGIASHSHPPRYARSPQSAKRLHALYHTLPDRAPMRTRSRPRRGADVLFRFLLTLFLPCQRVDRRRSVKNETAAGAGKAGA